MTKDEEDTDTQGPAPQREWSIGAHTHDETPVPQPALRLQQAPTPQATNQPTPDTHDKAPEIPHPVPNTPPPTHTPQTPPRAGSQAGSPPCLPFLCALQQPSAQGSRPTPTLPAPPQQQPSGQGGAGVSPPHTPRTAAGPSEAGSGAQTTQPSGQGGACVSPQQDTRLSPQGGHRRLDRDASESMCGLRSFALMISSDAEEEEDGVCGTPTQQHQEQLQHALAVLASPLRPQQALYVCGSPTRQQQQAASEEQQQVAPVVKRGLLARLGMALKRRLGACFGRASPWEGAAQVQGAERAWRSSGAIVRRR